ncbi:MAG: acetyltransferase-like isoleucine patch superfamily enzyme [Pseudohongiellaceae bacterium]|jgi:acetyltransferase-like isoleucine patch superfamily enzyme
MTVSNGPNLAPTNLLGKIIHRLRHGAPLFGYVKGLWLRRKFSSCGALAVAKGWFLSQVKNAGGELHAENILLYPGSRLCAESGGTLTIGNGTYLNRGAEVIAWENVEICRDCMIGWEALIMDADLHPVGDRPLRNVPVKLHDNVWIGCRAIALKGVTIGEGSIVSAGSIVTKDVPPYTVVGGQPARILGSVDDNSKTC